MIPEEKTVSWRFREKHKLFQGRLVSQCSAKQIATPPPWSLPAVHSERPAEPGFVDIRLEDVTALPWKSDGEPSEGGAGKAVESSPLKF